MDDTRRWIFIMFIACLLALFCIFVLNWSNADGQLVYRVSLPVIFGGAGQPTLAPTMPVGTPMPYPTPAPTPTDIE